MRYPNRNYLKATLFQSACKTACSTKYRFHLTPIYLNTFNLVQVPTIPNAGICKLSAAGLTGVALPARYYRLPILLAGFARAGEYSLNARLYLQKLYGTLPFKKGNIKAIRHVTTPTIGFNYRPDFGDPSYGYYKTAVSSATVPYPYYSQRYSIFEQSVYRAVFRVSRRVSGFSLDNTIEAKVKAKSTDTSGVDRKIPILQGLTFSSFYNFAPIP
jgi:hypothetical protein